MKGDAMKKLTVLMCMMVLLTLAACTKTAELAGKWQSLITPEITIEFRDDGTLNEYWEDVPTASYIYETNETSVTVDQNGDRYTLERKGDKLVYMGEALYQKQ